MNKIIVLWTEAIRLEDVSMSSYAGNCGLYQILVMEESNPENERLIYLGKTNSTFLKRICQHLSGTGGSGTFLKVKGQKFIRFGLIPRPFKCSDKTYRRMLDHAEAVDIDLLHPELNKKAGYRIPEYADVQVVNYKISDLLNQNVI